jgi:predicted dehydrogenase/threonine dehydrogenase-like Zn-dependent dehydrogenase
MGKSRRMLQVTQYQKTGNLRVEELPSPQLRTGSVLVRNVCSLISAGTERTSVETAQASTVGKARARPDLVRQVVDNAKREGVLATYRKVQTRLDNHKELGYSSAGVVLESAVPGIGPGDHVACAGTAHHAEIVSVPKNLVARIPDGVGFDQAAFVALGAIALQGVRQAEVGLGDSVAVIGLGLVGLLTLQLLKAQGCRVIGMDVDSRKFALARELGCDDCTMSDGDASLAVDSFTHGHGADAVVITASTRSNQPIELALDVARKKGTVVVVGAIGMDIPRPPFFEKEVDLRISFSFGPGRDDPEYEDAGVDYPFGYVRWTENRNMQAVLSLVAEGKLDTRTLVTHRYPIDRALEAYDLVTGKTKEPSLGIVLEYPERPDVARSMLVRAEPAAVAAATSAVAGFVGAGNFAQSYLLPPLKKLGVDLAGVATSRPVNARSAAEKFGFAFSTTDPNEVISDQRVKMVFIATRHDSHASLVENALAAGHHVFVEKPLAVAPDQLEGVRDAAAVAAERGQYLAVGFNRRFSAPIRDIEAFFADRREPLAITYRMNGGPLPRSSWVQAEGQGGRIVGDGCHAVDIFAALTGARPLRVYAASTRSDNAEVVDEDTVNVVINYSDGSVATLMYVANGESLPSERCEVSGGGRSVVMDDFRSATFHTGRSRKRRSYNGRKGHAEEIANFIGVVRGNARRCFSVETLVDTTAVTLAAVESLRARAAIEL